MRVPVLVLAGAVLAATPAAAHHPFSAEFDANAPVRLTGKVTQVDWSNPHVIIHMTTSAANGVQNWNLEAASPGDLATKGMVTEHLENRRADYCRGL
jgi:hypothetical protein